MMKKRPASAGFFVPAVSPAALRLAGLRPCTFVARPSAAPPGLCANHPYLNIQIIHVDLPIDK
jgi:hypothetical protein